MVFKVLHDHRRSKRNGDRRDAVSLVPGRRWPSSPASPSPWRPARAQRVSRPRPIRRRGSLSSTARLHCWPGGRAPQGHTAIALGGGRLQGGPPDLVPLSPRQPGRRYEDDGSEDDRLCDGADAANKPRTTNGRALLPIEHRGLQGRPHRGRLAPTALPHADDGGGDHLACKGLRGRRRGRRPSGHRHRAPVGRSRRSL